MNRSTLVATYRESNILDGRMIEDYLVEFNGKRFEAVDGGMRPNEPVEVVIVLKTCKSLFLKKASSK